MKNLKTFCGLTLLCLLFLIPLSGNANSIWKTESNFYELDCNYLKDITITVNIDWGRKSKGCIGFGICSIEVIVDMDIDWEGIFKVNSNDNNDFTLLFNDKGKKMLQNKFKGYKNVIVIEEDLILNHEICKKLELKDGRILKKGIYEILKDKREGYKIIFN